MKNTHWKTGSPPPKRRDVTWPARAQVLRQLGIGAAVVVVWGLLLAGYLSLTREAPSEPTSIAAATQPSASASAQPPSATPEPTVSATPEPSASAQPPSGTPETVASAAPTESSVAPSSTPEPSASAQPPSATPEPTALPAATMTPTPEALGVSFSADVLPIFESSCNRCHGSDRRAGLSLLTQADVLAGSSNGPVIVPGSAADSLLVESVETGRMPRGAPRLSDEAIQIIRDWIDAGAPDN